MSTFGLESELEDVVTSFHQSKIVEVLKLTAEANAAKSELDESLIPNIDRFFANLVANETDREVRREYAAFMKAKDFEIVDEMTLRFKATNWSKVIYFEASVTQLLAS